MYARLGVVTICLALVIGPFLSAPHYHWVHHTVSELGGQNMPNRWIMNLGLGGYGVGVMVASFYDWPLNKLINLAVFIFGAALLGTALWSALPIEAMPSGDPVEDSVHSFLANLVGFAFAAATAAALFAPDGNLRDWLSWSGLFASIAIPTLMFANPEWDGVMQRAMFAVSFVWIWRQYGPVMRSH